MTQQNQTEYFTIPADAVEKYQKMGEKFEGIQGYKADTGMLMWTCEGPVKKCSLEEALSVTTWWQDEWTIPGGIFNASHNYNY